VTLWGAAGIWLTYFSEARTRRDEEHKKIQNLLAGIRAELDLAKGWAGGDENNSGYLQSKTIEQLTREHEDWFHPARLIFTFDIPTIQGITTSPLARDLSEIVPAIVKLNYSFAKYSRRAPTFAVSRIKVPFTRPWRRSLRRQRTCTRSKNGSL
jgi:hypothetical protein